MRKMKAKGGPIVHCDSNDNVFHVRGVKFIAFPAAANRNIKSFSALKINPNGVTIKYA